MAVPPRGRSTVNVLTSLVLAPKLLQIPEGPLFQEDELGGSGPNPLPDPSKPGNGGGPNNSPDSSEHGDDTPPTLVVPTEQKVF